MTFFLTCFFVILYYIRPFEIIESLHGMPILQVVGIAGAISLFLDIILKKATLFKNGTDQMMVGFFLSIGMSHVRHLYFGGASKSMQEFLPIFIGYFLVAHSINSTTRLKVFIKVLILCTTFIAVEGVFEARDGSSYFGVKPFEQYMGLNNEGKPFYISRIKWVGTFEDPNDLAMAFVVAVPLLLKFILDKKYLLPAGLLGIICYAINLTNSRGGIVATLAAVFAFLTMKYRSVKGVILGGSLSFILIAMGDRMSAGEESAHGRIEAWSEGYQMFKSSPLFGLGKGEFTDNFELTAHNSFVLVLSELGMFGVLFFVGMFYFALTSGYKSTFSGKWELIESDLLNTYIAIWSSLIGLIASIFFLSRSYAFLPYMLIALSMSFVNLKNHESEFVNAYIADNSRNMINIFKTTCCGIGFIYIMIKILL